MRIINVILIYSVAGAGHIPRAATPKPAESPRLSQLQQIGDIVSVLRFKGVDPTGVSDSTAGIQSAIAYAIATGRELYIPGGVYLCNKVTDGIILNVLANQNASLVHSLGWVSGSVGARTHGGITIRGAGPDKTIIRTTSKSGDLMAAVSFASTIYYPHYSLSGFTLQGPDIVAGGEPLCPFSASNGVSGNGLRITGTNSSRVIVRDVNSEFFCGPGKAALWLDTAEEFHLSAVELRYSDIGLKLTTDTNASSADGLKLDSNLSYGGYIERNTGTTFANLEVQGNCRNGLFLRTVSSMTVTSPYFEHNGYCGGGRWHALSLNYVLDSFMTAMTLVTATDHIFLDGVAGTDGRLAVNARNFFSIGGPSGFQAGARITLTGPGTGGNVWVNALPSWFSGDPTITETLINPVGPFSAGSSSVISPSIRTGSLSVNGPISVGGGTGITGSTCTHWTGGLCDHR